VASPLANAVCSGLALPAVGTGTLRRARGSCFGGFFCRLALAQLADAVSDLRLQLLHALGVALGAVLALAPLCSWRGRL